MISKALRQRGLAQSFQQCAAFLLSLALAVPRAARTSLWSRQLRFTALMPHYSEDLRGLLNNIVKENFGEHCIIRSCLIGHPYYNAGLPRPLCVSVRCVPVFRKLVFSQGDPWPKSCKKGLFWTWTHFLLRNPARSVTFAHLDTFGR